GVSLIIDASHLDAEMHNLSSRVYWWDSKPEAWGRPLAWKDTPGENSTQVLWFEGNCSGYGIFTLGRGEFTVAFSAPLVGSNKLGVGIGGQAIWDRMDDHNYEVFTEHFDVAGRKIRARCRCTGGEVNAADVVLSYAEDPNEYEFVDKIWR